jgi:hypothetical protein
MHLLMEWQTKNYSSIYLLVGGHRSLNEALNQTFKVQVVKAADRPPARLQEVT